MRVVFLDFDGVLNTENYQAKLQAEGKFGWDDFGMLFAPEAVENLKRILDAVPDVKIVVSSSWKANGIDDLRLMWSERGLPGALLDVTPTVFCEDLLTVDLSDPDNIRKIEGLGKGREINSWLQRKAESDCRYVIFDDLAEFIRELARHYIPVNPETGITEDDARNAIKMLT